MNLFPVRIRKLRTGRHLVKGGTGSFSCTAADGVKAEVRGKGKDQWVRFTRGAKWVWSCNTTYFRTWFNYADGGRTANAKRS